MKLGTKNHRVHRKAAIANKFRRDYRCQRRFYRIQYLLDKLQRDGYYNGSTSAGVKL